MTSAPKFTYADLTDPCPVGDCDDGTVYNPAWRAWWQRHNAAREAWLAAHPGEDWYASETYKALDDDAPEGDEEYNCPSCRGTSRVPNAAGHAVLQLVAQWTGRP